MRKIDEENQNENQGLTDTSGSMSRQANNTIKNGTKTAAKAAVKLAAKTIAKLGIRVLLPIILILVLLASFIYFITIDDGVYHEGDMSSTPYVASTYIKSVTIDGNGLTVHIKDKDGNEIKDDPSTTDVNEAYQYLWDQMIKAGNPIETYLSKPEELVKMMNTEIITQYPYIDTAPANALNGLIKFKRPKELGEDGYLSYTDKDTFQGYIDEYNNSRSSSAKANALKHFTLDDERNAVVAKWTEVNNEVSTNDPSADATAEPNTQSMTTTKINYKNVVKPYTLPFNYMWAWLVIGEDKTFIFGDKELNLKGFVDLIENTKLDISILDNTTTLKEVDEYNYYKMVTRQKDNGDNTTSTEEVREGPYNKTYTKTTITDSLDVKLTYADTWIVKYENKYIMPSDSNRDKTRDSNTVTNTTNIPDEESGDTRVVDNVNTTTTTTTVDKFVQDAAGKVVTPKLDKDDPNQNFMTILCDPENTQTRTFVLEIPDWLFEILESNSDTSNMVDLTKYILYKMSGIDFGVTEYDFSEYISSDFSTATGDIVGSNIEEKVWFGLKNLGYSDYAAAGAMGNIRYESGSFDPTAVEGGYTESNGGIGICQWTNDGRGSSGRNTNLRNYAQSKGTTWQDENIQVTFLIAELSTGGGADGYASYQLMSTQSYYGSSLANPSSWINATNVEDATQAFAYSFERPAKSAATASMPTRIQYAQEYYQKYQGKEAPTTVDTKLTGENKEKMEKMIAEAIRIANDDRYQYSQGRRDEEFFYDCSSFVSRLYNKYFGIPRLDYGASNTGTGNIEANCTSKYSEVSLSDLQPGDIAWKATHAALYIGNNQTAEASGTNAGIVVKTMGSSFTRYFRIIK